MAKKMLIDLNRCVGCWTCAMSCKMGNHLPDDEYLVFRTRTATNQLGQVMSANYGRIGEKPNLAIGLSMKAWFNPKANDANLEDARVW